MSLTFTKATKEKRKLRMAVCGVSGSGKTWTSLAIATGIVEATGGKIAVIDTENHSASLYADDFSFDTLCLDRHAPENFVEAIHAAEKAGYAVIIIDSGSHAWSGRGGALEMVDEAAKRSRSGNSFTAWRDVTPEHNKLVDAMMQCKAHLIFTMRSKTEYALEDDGRGKKAPKKIGMAPVQRDGLEYEFDIVADMDKEGNTFVVSKTRMKSINGRVVKAPTKELGKEILAWLTSGADAKPSPEPTPEPTAGGQARTDAQPPASNGNGKRTDPLTGVKKRFAAWCGLKGYEARDAFARVRNQLRDRYGDALLSDPDEPFATDELDRLAASLQEWIDAEETIDSVLAPQETA